MIVNHRDRSEPPRSESCQTVTERPVEVRVCTGASAARETHGLTPSDRDRDRHGLPTGKGVHCRNSRIPRFSAGFEGS
eukprot:1750475-Rhodomonas_salina.1